MKSLLLDEIRREQVRARGQDLPDLDPGGADLLEGHAQTRRRAQAAGRLLLLLLPPADESPQPQGVHHLREAVARYDARDMDRPASVAGQGLPAGRRRGIRG